MIDSRRLPLTTVVASLILIVAAFLRFYHLTSAPPGLNGDEVFNAIDALRIGRGHWPLFLEGNYGREALFFYLMALSLKLLGSTIFAIRLPSALLGIGVVGLTFLNGRSFFNERVALFATGLTAVSLWPLMGSRWGLRAVSLTFFTALTIWLLARAWQNGRWRDWALAGVSFGLTFYTYIPARVFPLVLLGWFGWLFWCQRERLRTYWQKAFLFCLLATVIFLPFGIYMWQYPEKVNQRVDSLAGGALVQLKEGELTALLPPALGILKMFTVEGDEDWRYHLAHKPVFDPITSVFFYIGVGVALWGAFRGTPKENRPVYALMLLWLGGMLSPNLFVDDNPSFLRASGAIVPLYLLTAVGVEAVWQRSVRRWPTLRQQVWVYALLGTIGLALLLQGTWHAYFQEWNQFSEVRRIYQADLTAIATYLEENPPPTTTAVFIGHEYALDVAPRTFSFNSEREVAWFTSANTFPWSPAQEAWYFIPFGEALPPTAVQEAVQLAAVAETIPFADGAPAFTLYKVNDVAWPPVTALTLPFIDGPSLRGYEMAESAYRGDTLPLTLHWQIPAGMSGRENALTYVELLLKDEQGNVWQQARALLGYPQTHWAEGDFFAQLIELPIPLGMPPGVVTIHFSLFDNNGRAFLPADSRVAHSQPLLIRSRPLSDFTPTPAMPIWAETLVLQSSSFSTLLTPGLAVDIALDWVALKAPSADYRVQLSLHLPGDDTLYLPQVSAIWPEQYPPSQWQSGEQVTTFHRFIVPNQLPLAFTAETAPQLRVDLLPPTDESPLPFVGENQLAEMTLILRERQFNQPPLPIPLAEPAKWADGMHLLGYDLDMTEAHAGGALRLTLIWQTETTPTTNYTEFNHLAGADNQIIGQLDNPPSGEAWLTATWLPGEIIVEVREIPIAQTAVPGTYPLFIGFYTPNDGKRLPVRVAGAVQANDQLLLTEVEITR